MGIPSPFVAPIASPLLRLKQADLNQSELELLPVSSLDLDSGKPVLRPSTPPTSSGDERAESPSSDDDSVEAAVVIEEPKQEAESDPWSAAGAENEADYQLVWGSCLQLWCRLQPDGTGGTLVIPCTTETVGVAQDLEKNGISAVSAADLMTPCSGEGTSFGTAPAGSTYAAIWCCVRPDSEGGMVVVPCTEAPPMAEALFDQGPPLTSAELMCTPPQAPEGAYAPAWVYGSEWPFNCAPTTLLLRNLPVELTQEDLLDVLDREEFSGFYDFVYLSEGSAVINLTRHAYGLALAARMHGRKAWGVGAGETACETHWSLPEQGMAGLIEAYRDHPAHSKEDSVAKPTIFKGGWPAPFPKSTSETAVEAK